MDKKTFGDFLADIEDLDADSISTNVKFGRIKDVLYKLFYTLYTDNTDTTDKEDWPIRKMCILGDRNGNDPEYSLLKITMPEKYFEDGFHFDRALGEAQLKGFREPLILDETDALFKALKLHELPDWENAEIIPYSGKF